MAITLSFGIQDISILCLSSAADFQRNEVILPMDFSSPSTKSEKMSISFLIGLHRYEVLISPGVFLYSCNKNMKNYYHHVPVLSAERKTVSKQLSWHCLSCSECLSLLDIVVTIGSVHTFWHVFCPFEHITTSSVFEVSIPIQFHVKPVCSSYTFNDKKPKL